MSKIEYNYLMIKVGNMYLEGVSHRSVNLVESNRNAFRLDTDVYTSIEVKQMIKSKLDLLKKHGFENFSIVKETVTTTVTEEGISKHYFI